jgi:alpha 1,6-mannosyltransferase
MASHSWKKLKDFNYYFYDDEMCDRFIKENYDENVYKAYQKCPLNVMKADLWRYCVIYKYGGIYADTDTVLITDHVDFFINNNSYLVVSPENNVHFCQWVFAAPSGSPIIKEIIDLSVKRILEINEIKGTHIVHELTGPGVFSDAVLNYLKKNNKPILSDDSERNCLRYIHYSSGDLIVLDSDDFHKNKVIHFFTGSLPTGWTNERNQKLL